MSNIKVVGIDLAKDIFQVCVLSEDNQVLFNRKVSRPRLLDQIRRFEPGTLIAMEACSSAHYWGRTFEQMEYRVMLIPPQHVKAFVGHQKNDARDALGICEAAMRPGIHPVPIKSDEQLDLKALLSERTWLVRERTSLANHLRGLAKERGVYFPKKIESLRVMIPKALEDAENSLTPAMRRLMDRQYHQLLLLDAEIRQLEKEIQQLGMTQAAYKRLLAIPGFGPLVTASLIAELGDGSQFENGRGCAAWAGLVPKQHSSGGKQRLQGITKNGSRTLRTLLIHGARAVVRVASKHDTPHARWVQSLIVRRGKNVSIVALANKMARIGWKVLASGQEFDPAKAFSAT